MTPTSNPRRDIANFLLEKNINYRIYNHKPIYSIADGREISEYIGVKPCKTLLLVNRRHQYYMLLTMGDCRISLTDFSRHINSSHLSFASSEALETLLHASPGAVSPLGLIFDTAGTISLCVDKILFQQEFIALHPCVNNESYVFKTSDFFNLFLPSVNYREYMIIE